MSSISTRTAIAALALLVAIGTAASAVWQFNAVASHIANEALASSQALQASALEHRQARLRELTDVLTGDTHFTTYITQALSVDAGSADVVDIVSIHDQLEQRRSSLHLDSVAIVDGEGRIVVAVGEGFSGTKTLSATPVVTQANKIAGPVDGFIELGGRALWASVSPLRPGESDAKLVTAFVVDGVTMKEVARPSRAEVALLAATASHWRVVASSFVAPAATQVQDAVNAQPPGALAAAQNASSPALYLRLADGSWSARPTALKSADNLVLVTLVSAAAANDAWPAIAFPAALLAAVVLACLVGLLIHFQRSFATPLANLTMLSERAVKGDYDMVYRGRESGPVGRLGGVFNHLLNDLRQFRPVPGAPRRRRTDRS